MTVTILKISKFNIQEKDMKVTPRKPAHISAIYIYIYIYIYNKFENIYEQSAQYRSRADNHLMSVVPTSPCIKFRLRDALKSNE